MTQERFIKLIENPDLLATISLEELKTLAFAYPYAHNLRYLLALKAEQIDHPDAARFLQSAAAYSLDRKHLFMLIMPQKLTPVPLLVAEKESVLELKPIETVQKALDALSPMARFSEASASDQEISLPEPSVAPTETIFAAPDATVLPPGQPSTMPPVEALPVFTPIVPASVFVPSEQVLPQLPEKQSFGAWFEQFHPPSLAPERPAAVPMKKIKPLPMVKKEPVLTGLAQVLAEKSVAENQSVISETLARLLVQQGHKEKAIHMYQRLSLAFPEKSAYFAAEIDKLKK